MKIEKFFRQPQLKKLNNGLTKVNKNIGLGCKKIVW